MYLSISSSPTLHCQSHPPPTVSAVVYFAQGHLVSRVIEVQAFLSVSVSSMLFPDVSKAEKGGFCDVEPYLKVYAMREVIQRCKGYQRAQ